MPSHVTPAAGGHRGPQSAQGAATQPSSHWWGATAGAAIRGGPVTWLSANRGPRWEAGAATPQ
jgi:hypothetical protein